MHIVITGGLGFIGSNFIRSIIDSNDVYITNIDAQTYAGTIDNLIDIEDKKNYSCIKGFIQDERFINDTFKKLKPDMVINFAAESHVDRSIENSRPFIDTNIIGTHVLLEASLNNDIKKYIQISTDEVYGSITAPDKFTETSQIKPNSPYSASKASADHLVRAYYKTYGLNTIIIRCSNNYGPYQFPEKVIPYFISLALNGKRLPVYGDGLNIRDWIYVIDFCNAISLVSKKGISGEVYNVGGDCEITNIELTKTLLKILGKSEDLIEFVKDRLGHDRRYAMDSSKIEKELGWKRKYNFNDGINKTVEWYLNNNEWINKRLNQNLILK